MKTEFYREINLKKIESFEHLSTRDAHNENFEITIVMRDSCFMLPKVGNKFSIGKQNGMIFSTGIVTEVMSKNKFKTEEGIFEYSYSEIFR